MLCFVRSLQSKYKISSIYSIYSGVKCILFSKYNISSESWEKVKALLKNIGKYYAPKSKPVLSNEQSSLFLTNADDAEYRNHKLALIIGVAGALRKSDYIRIKQHSVSILRDDNGVEYLKICLIKSKVDREQVFFILQEDNVKKIKSYIQDTAAFHNNHGDGNFWWQIRFINDAWRLHRQHLGVNWFGKYLFKVAEYLGLPNYKDYTSHVVRHSSATNHANAGGSLLQLKNHGLWKSNSAAERYVHNSDIMKRCNASMVEVAADNVQYKDAQNNDIEGEDEDVEDDEEQDLELQPPLKKRRLHKYIFNNCIVNFH